MGARVLLNALAFLALTATLTLAQTKTEPCPDNKKRCTATGRCQDTCEKEQKVNISATLAVKELISAETSAVFTIQELLDDVQSTIVSRNAMVKIMCPKDSTVQIDVTQGRTTNALTQDTVVSLGDSISIAVVENRSPDLQSLYKCLVTTQPDDATTDPVKTFGLIAAILPLLPMTDVILKNITLTRDETLKRVPLSALIELRSPGLDIEVGTAFVGQEKDQTKDENQIEEAPAVAMLLKKLKDAITAHKDATRNVELLIEKPRNSVELDLAFRVDRAYKSFIGTKMNFGTKQKALVYIDKPLNVPIGLSRFTVKKFSEFVRIPESLWIGIEVIKNKNFPPFLKTRTDMEPKLLPSDILEFSCGKDFLDLFDDRNIHDTLSCVILFASSSVKGSWKYEKDSDVFEDVSVRDLSKTPDDVTLSLETVVISAKGKLKFMLDKSTTEEMNFKEALRYTSIFVMATDGTNLENQQQFPYKLNLNLTKCKDDPKYPCLHGPNTAVSSTAANLFVYPQCSRTCDDEIVCGLQVSAETCPICKEGYELNECTDKCYDPQNEIQKMEGKDCRGKCDFGDYQRYPITNGEPMCLPTGLTADEIQQHICVTVNKGQLNRCQRCYGGNTTKTKTEGLDRCGVCDGDGLCEVDCDGVPNGPKTEDTCGQCLDPKSKEFNTKSGSPIKIGRIKPAKVFAVGEIMFEMSGCNMHLLKETPRCSLTKGNSMIQLLIAKLDRLKMSAKHKMTGVAAGIYSLRCTLPKDTIATDGIDVTVLATPSISSIKPSSANMTEEVNVTLCGSNLNSNTEKLKCAMTCPYLTSSKTAQTRCTRYGGNRYIIMDASSTKDGCVLCHSAGVFKRINEPGEIKVAALLDKQMLSSFNDLSPATITITADAPVLQKVTFEAFCKLQLTFDRPISGPSQASQLFLPAFDSYIYYRSTRLIAKLKDGVLLQEGATISVLHGVIRQRSKHSENANANALFPITVPPVEEVPKLEIRSTSPGNLAACQKTSLSLVVKGVGSCVKLAYQWSVRNVSGDADQQFTQKIESATTRHLLIGKQDLEPGTVYEITAKLVTPALEAKYLIERNAEEKALFVRLVSQTQLNPTNGVVIKAKVSMPSCGSTQSIVAEDTSRFRFVLKNDRNKTILFSTNFKSNKFVIRRGTLTGGKIYTITVTVYYGESKTTAETLLRIPLSELKMEIDFDAKVNVNKDVKLTSKLRDPNNSPKPPLFIWMCKQESRNGILQLCPKSLAEIFSTAKTDKLSILAGELMPDSCYEVTVIAEAGDKRIKKTVKMCCVANDPPKVRISAETPAESRPFKLKIFLKIQEPVILTFSCTFGTDDDCDGFNVEEMALDKSRRGIIRKAIKSSTEKWIPGKYTIEIHVTSQIDPNIVTTASTIIEVPQLPNLGDVQITPQTGGAWDTKFTIDFNIEEQLDNFDTLKILYSKTSKPGDDLKTIGILRKESQSLEIRLPGGELNIRVEGCKTGICTEKKLEQAVDVKEISEEDVLRILTDLPDLDELIEVTNTMVDSDDSLSPSPQLKEKLKVAALQIANEMSSEIPEESVKMLDKLKHVITIIPKTGELKDALIEKVGQLLRDQTEATRRKRSVDDGIVQPLSVDAAQTLLLVLVNLYQNVSEDDITQADGVKFVNDMETIGYRLCANPELGYPDSEPLFLNTMDVLLKVNDLSIDGGFSARNYNMTCTNCSEYTNNTAQIQYVESVADELTSWNCTEDIICTSACFVTAMMKKDFLSAGMESRAKLDYNSSARASDIIVVFAANPETHKELTFTPFEKRFNLTVPVTTDSYELMSYALQCNAWVDNTWSTDPCLTSTPMIGHDGTYRVVCSCVGFGYFSVMKEQIDESVTSTTSMASYSSSETSTKGSESSSSATESSTSSSESATMETESSTMKSESSSPSSDISTSAIKSSMSPGQSSTPSSESASMESESSTMESESSTMESESSTMESESSTSSSESASMESGSSTMKSESSTSSSKRASMESGSSTMKSGSSTMKSVTMESGSLTMESESSSSSSESSTSSSEGSSSSVENSTVGNDGSTTATTVTTTVTRVGSTANKEIKFKVSGSMSQLTANATLSEVKTSLTNQIAEHLGVSAERIQNLEVHQVPTTRRKRSGSPTGSIIVTFVLVATGLPSESSVNDLENMIRDAIVNGNLTLTDASGNALSVDPTSFQSRVVSPPPDQEKEKKHHLVPIIIGSVVGVFCLILVVIIIVVVVKAKNKKRSILDDTPSPSTTPTSVSSSSLNREKQNKKQYIYGVSASPLPEKPGAEKSKGVRNQGYEVEKDSGPSRNSTRTNSPRSLANSRTATRYDASLSREGTTTSHGSQNDNPRRNMTPIG